MQKSVILIGILAIGLTMTVVTTIGSLATFPESQARNNIEHRGNMPMMQHNKGSMMNMMSMDSMMDSNIMSGNMGMQDMMDQMMGSNYVHIGMHRFMPSDMRTSVGTKITWQNHDHVKHNVVGVFKKDSGDKIWVRSPDLSHMSSWSYTFSESGTFEYVCSYHESEGMQGRILIST